MSPYPHFREAIADGHLVENVYANLVVIHCERCARSWERRRDEGRRATIADRTDAGWHSVQHDKDEWEAIRQEQENAYEAGISRGLIER